MRKVLTKLAVAAAVLAGAVTSAQAYVVLTIEDLSTATVTSCSSIGICGAGWLITDVNNLTFIGNVGVFHVQATQGSANTPGNPLVAFSDSTSLAVTRTDVAAGLKGLKVTFDAIDYTAPTANIKSMTGSASDTSQQFGATDFVASQFYVDSAGGAAFASPLTAPYAGGIPTALDGKYNTGCFFFVDTNGSCAAGTINWVDPSAPLGTFSTRIEQNFSIVASTRVNTTGSMIIRVPEPMSTALVGIALFGLALTSRRRAAKKA